MRSSFLFQILLAEKPKPRNKVSLIDTSICCVGWGMNRDETVAPFLQGREAWNAWAEQMLAERRALEAAGTWKSRREYSDERSATTPDKRQGAFRGDGAGQANYGYSITIFGAGGSCFSPLSLRHSSAAMDL
jgi:hypothetical protein